MQTVDTFRMENGGIEFDWSTIVLFNIKIGWYGKNVFCLFLLNENKKEDRILVKTNDCLCLILNFGKKNTIFQYN